MTEHTAYTPLWMLIFSCFGLMVGWALGEELSRRRCAEEKVDELQHRLRPAGTPTQERQLKEMRSVLNDAHKRIVAVSKGLKNPAR